MLRRKVYTTRAEKLSDLMIGAAVSMSLGACAFFGTWGLSTDPGNQTLYQVWLSLPVAATLGLMVFFALTRRWIALGMLATFGVLLVIALCLTMVLGAMCGSRLGQGGY